MKRTEGIMWIFKIPLTLHLILFLSWKCSANIWKCCRFAWLLRSCSSISVKAVTCRAPFWRNDGRLCRSRTGFRFNTPTLLQAPRGTALICSEHLGWCPTSVCKREKYTFSAKPGRRQGHCLLCHVGTWFRNLSTQIGVKLMQWKEGRLLGGCFGYSIRQQESPSVSRPAFAQNRFIWCVIQPHECQSVCSWSKWPTQKRCKMPGIGESAILIQMGKITHHHPFL